MAFVKRGCNQYRCRTLPVCGNRAVDNRSFEYHRKQTSRGNRRELAPFRVFDKTLLGYVRQVRARVRTCQETSKIHLILAVFGSILSFRGF